MDDFPPDLSRLGRDLTAAIDRSLRRKRFRRRLANRAAKAGVFGALIFVAMTPAVLQPANVGIEEQPRTPGSDDAKSVAQRCESPNANSVPLCSDAPHFFVEYAAQRQVDEPSRCARRRERLWLEVLRGEAALRREGYVMSTRRAETRSHSATGSFTPTSMGRC